MDAEEKRESIILKNKKIILYIAILIIVIATIAIFVVISGNNKYKDLENSMLATTKSYVRSGRIDFKDQYYFTISQMGMKEIHDCNKDSGVLIKNENNSITYQVYLICDSYKSETMKSTSSKYIEIIGANPLIVENNTAFSDPGYNSNGYRVESSSNFKNTPGLYIVSYQVFEGTALKETVNRYVIVSNVASSDAPVITLNGDANVIIKVGGTYVEPGFYAIDPTDGNITGKVSRVINVDTNTIGDYEVIYKVTNSKGLTSTKKRIVSVIDKDLNIYAQSTLSPEVATKDKVIINLKIIGNTYSHIVLPDGKTSNDTSIEYEVKENDLYVFKIYDTYGNFSEKKVFIDTIDRIPPTGRCSAVSQGGVVTYTVNADDDSGIKGYSYYTGIGYTEYKSEDTFKYTMDYNGASVIVQDIAGNITKVSCSTKKISTITSATIPDSKTIYVGDSYTIPVTITPTSGDKKEIYFDVISGGQYITLSNGVVTGVAAGTAVVRMRVTDSTISEQITITVKKKQAQVEWHSDPSDTSDTASWCTKKAAVLTGYMNGSQIADRSSISMNVGETITITLYLTKECGQVKQLTRTSADGQTNWRDYFTAKSSPSVDRYDSSTFANVDHFDWIITAKKKASGVILTQTTTQSTSKYREIKSFFHITVTAK